MDLSTHVINIDVKNAPNVDGVMVTVQGVANCKISSKPELLENAVESLLGKTQEEIDTIIYQNLEGHLRSVVGKMTIEALIGDKQKLNKAVLEDAIEDFKKIGVDITSLNIQNITDQFKYIENLGKKRVAEIQRDADIGKAEAERDSKIKTSNAEKEGISQKNLNDQLIAESNKELSIKNANMKAMVDTRNAEVAQAGPLSNANALKAVLEAEANTAAAKEKANIVVEEMRAKKQEAALNATLIVPATAEKAQRIINAEATQKSAIVEAEGIKQSMIIKANGEGESMVIRKKAEAEGNAAVIVQMGEAEGKAIKAKLVGEAEGIAAKAEAYAKLDQTGKFLEILNALQTLAPNVIKEFAGVMGETTKHLANIKEVKVIDFGGGKDGSGSVSKFGSIPVEILTKVFEGLTGAGMDPSKLFNFMGVNPTTSKPEEPKTTTEKK